MIDLDILPEIPRFVVARQTTQEWEMRAKENRDYFVLVYARSGGADYWFPQEYLRITPGNILLIPPRIPYRGESDRENPWAYISVGVPLVPADPESERLLTALPRVFRHSGGQAMEERFAELHRVWVRKPQGYRMRCRSLISYILLELFRDSERQKGESAYHHRLDRILMELREHVDGSYTNESLAKLMGVSPSYFRQLFRDYTGMTLVQFRNRLRVEKAKELLLSRSCNVTEAARAVGIGDVCYFSRLFRQITGQSPSDYLHSL